ncbi:hypothetical protein O181_035991 [Austropuccinia psidii MF-1]|uniref:Integrase zinc-binding domain-containing protein n=1 Tax=Austropuccinia psidii MF-1 TaxID=1389203 RepID=A0A9Q3D3L0_9BASI|nr:hypothetical protein [Austropuccinia psidii MF-1]
MNMLYKERKSHTDVDGLRRWPLDNFKSNPAYDPEVAAKIHIHFIEKNMRKNFRFFEWIPEIGTPESGDTEPEGRETPILGISFSELPNIFLTAVMKTYAKHKQENHISALKVMDRDHISLILQECPDCPYMGHMSQDRTKERVARTAWWPKWEQELIEYINTCERWQKENRKHGKKYGPLQHIEEPKHPG